MNSNKILIRIIRLEYRTILENKFCPKLIIIIIVIIIIIMFLLYNSMFGNTKNRCYYIYAIFLMAKH